MVKSTKPIQVKALVVLQCLAYVSLPTHKSPVFSLLKNETGYKTHRNNVTKKKTMCCSLVGGTLCENGSTSSMLVICLKGSVQMINSSLPWSLKKNTKITILSFLLVDISRKNAAQKYVIVMMSNILKASILFRVTRSYVVSKVSQRHLF